MPRPLRSVFFQVGLVVPGSSRATKTGGLVQVGVEESEPRTESVQSSPGIGRAPFFVCSRLVHPTGFQGGTRLGERIGLLRVVLPVRVCHAQHSALDHRVEMPLLEVPAVRHPRSFQQLGQAPRRVADPEDAILRVGQRAGRLDKSGGSSR